MALDRATVTRYLRTPKGLFTLVLLVLTLISATHEGWRLVWPSLVGATVVAMLIDAPILRQREGEWLYPDGALLTGWIIALILSPHEPWYVACVTSAVAVVSKYVARSGRANVFNPAALGLVATFYVFDTGQSWWGALPELPMPWIAALFVTGVYITIRLNKAPLVLAFLGTYYVLVTATAFVADPARVVELYRAPDLHAALFFAFFMATDPPTSPPKHRDQLIYGAITAVVGYAVFELIGAAYFLLAGVLVANIWEGLRKSRAARARQTKDFAVAS